MYLDDRIAILDSVFCIKRREPNSSTKDLLSASRVLGEQMGEGES
jgi:hypothetical protein